MGGIDCASSCEELCSNFHILCCHPLCYTGASLGLQIDGINCARFAQKCSANFTLPASSPSKIRSHSVQSIANTRVLVIVMGKRTHTDNKLPHHFPGYSPIKKLVGAFGSDTPASHTFTSSRNFSPSTAHIVLLISQCLSNACSPPPDLTPFPNKHLIPTSHVQALLNNHAPLLNRFFFRI